jgi:hypothetical protein
MAIAGYIVLAAGAVAVFITSNATGSAALIIAGAALAALGAWGNRIRSLSAGGVKVTLDQAARALEEADHAEALGQTERATTLRAQAHSLLRSTKGIADEYDDVRASMPSSWERTQRMEEVIEKAKRLVADKPPTPAQVQFLFDEGSAANRITALAMIQQNGKLANAATLLFVLANPSSSFEQFQTLRAIEAAVTANSWSATNKRTVRETLRDELSSGRLGIPSSDRTQLAGRILELLSA